MDRAWITLALLACNPRGPALDFAPAPGPDDESAPYFALDADGDGVPADVDCDDRDRTVFPGAPDFCGDDRVTDCDRTSDDGLVTVDGSATFTDLGDALATALGGSRVLVCPGVYVGQFESPVAVDLMAHGGPTATLLDGNLWGTVLSVPGGSAITGFTVTRGLGDIGGGIAQTSGGTLTITDCDIVANRATTGGGIATWTDSDVVLADSTVSRNQAVNSGGGLSVDAGTTVDLTGSTVDGNVAWIGGGALVVDGDLVGGIVSNNVSNQDAVVWIGLPVGGGGISASGDVSLTGVEIADNLAWGAGGGIAVSDGTLSLVGVLVHDNACEPVGGGLYAQHASVELDVGSEVSENFSDLGGGAALEVASLTGGSFVENIGDDFGGGAYLVDSAVEVVTFRDNHADHGGAVAVDGVGTITGGSMVNNYGVEAGGGIYVQSGSSLSAEGVELVENFAEYGGALHTEGDAVLTACIVGENEAAYGGGASIHGPGTLSSVSTDWAVDDDDNLPSDVYARRDLVGYGAAATFDCTEDGCTPEP